MIYEFGVMSNKWSLEAESEDIAKVSMCMFIGKNIPIAIYKPTTGAFLPSTILEKHEKDLDSSEFTRKTLEAHNTIKEIKLSGDN